MLPLDFDAPEDDPVPRRRRETTTRASQRRRATRGFAATENDTCFVAAEDDTSLVVPEDDTCLVVPEAADYAASSHCPEAVVCGYEVPADDAGDFNVPAGPPRGFSAPRTETASSTRLRTTGGFRFRSESAVEMQAGRHTRTCGARAVAVASAREDQEEGQEEQAAAGRAGRMGPLQPGSVRVSPRCSGASQQAGEARRQRTAKMPQRRSSR